MAAQCMPPDRRDPLVGRYNWRVADRAWSGAWGNSAAVSSLEPPRTYARGHKQSAATGR